MRIPFRHGLFAALLLPSLALAWGPEGHRIIGELAQRQLTPQAAAAVAGLLKGEPEPTLAGIANWADELRDSDPDFALAEAFCAAALSRGAYFHPRHNMFLCAAHTQHDMETALHAADAGFAAVARMSSTSGRVIV
jgi:glutamate-1-semialdehyde aminotransferase